MIIINLTIYIFLKHLNLLVILIYVILLHNLSLSLSV